MEKNMKCHGCLYYRKHLCVSNKCVFDIYEYTEDEICGFYKNCKNQEDQIKILSELCLKPQSEIRRILKKHGYSVPKLKRKKKETKNNVKENSTDAVA